jgi:hypothetical protein
VHATDLRDKHSRHIPKMITELHPSCAHRTGPIEGMASTVQVVLRLALFRLY